MSEPTEPGDAGLPKTEAVQGPSAGTQLRQAREAAGLSLSALAIALKVPQNKLQALEDDRWDRLLDAVFARALAGSVCRFLKIDSAPILQGLPHPAAANPLPESSGLNEPFRTPSDLAREGLRAKLLRPGPIAALALLAAAGAVWLWPYSPAPDAEPTPTPAQVETAPQAPAAVVEAPAETGMVKETVPTPAAPAPVTAASVPVVAAAPAPVPAPAPMPAPAVAAPAAPPAAKPAASAPTAPATAGGLLAFDATADTWVQVTDARGKVVLSRMLSAGQSASVSSGALPMSVVVGRATAVRVSVRGEVKDLQSIARENTARFEVK